MHLVNPKFIAFKGPSDKREKISPGLYTLTAANYIDVFLVRPLVSGDSSLVQPACLRSSRRIWLSRTLFHFHAPAGSYHSPS